MLEKLIQILLLDRYLLIHLINVKPYSTKKRLSKKKILGKLNKQEEFINVVLELGPNAIAQFKKYHSLRVSISYTNPYQATGILKTFQAFWSPCF
jgi:hypothetical protein